MKEVEDMKDIREILAESKRKKEKIEK